MNLICSTCHNSINCTNCSSKSIDFNRPASTNNNDFQTTELSGSLTRNLGNKQDKNGKDFYFGTLRLDDYTEQIFFFFDPDYDLLNRLNALNQGDRIKVSGFFNRTGRFTAKKLIDNKTEVELF